MIRTNITAKRLSYGDFSYSVTIVYRLTFLRWTVRYLAKRKEFGLGFWWFVDGDKDLVAPAIAAKLNSILTDKLAAKQVKPVPFSCGPQQGFRRGGIVDDSQW